MNAEMRQRACDVEAVMAHTVAVHLSNWLTVLLCHDVDAVKTA